jgi:hypothetical protein
MRMDTGGPLVEDTECLPGKRIVTWVRRSAFRLFTLLVASLTVMVSVRSCHVRDAIHLGISRQSTQTSRELEICSSGGLIEFKYRREVWPAGSHRTGDRRRLHFSTQPYLRGIHDYGASRYGGFKFARYDGRAPSSDEVLTYQSLRLPYWPIVSDDELTS